MSRVLKPISVNKPRGKHLNDTEKALLYGQALAGKDVEEIANENGLRADSLRKTFKSISERGTVQTSPRSGRPRVYDDRLIRRAIRKGRETPDITWASLQDHLGLKIDIVTMRKWFTEAGLQNWRKKKRPYLSEASAAARYKWANKHLHWTAEDWSKVMFTDECSVERGRGAKPAFVFRTPAQKWTKEMVETEPAGKQLRQMVWGAIWGQCPIYRSNCIALERDFDAKKNGYSSRSYIKILDENLLILYQDHLLFAQDNAPIHKSKATMKWLNDNGVRLLELPPYSPDMNCIEHMWSLLKQKLLELYPDLVPERSMDEESRAKLIRCIQDAWLKIDKQTIRSLITSMPARVQALYDARGWHTKY